MTAKTKNGNQPQGGDGARKLAALIDPSGKIRLANREKAFQQKIEKMQLQLATKEVRYKKEVARGLKELVNARKMEELLKNKGIVVLSDYSHLHEIYESDLRPITDADFQREADAKAEQFLTSGNKVTAAQEKVVRELFSLEARTNQLGIEQVRDFLILKHQIKETPADKKRISQKEELVKEEIAA